MASDLNTEVENRISSDENIQNQIDVIESGQLGSIKPTDAAPTPARNGNYTFSIGGAKPAWLTAEAGITTVKAGDGVAVVYMAPSSYSYTHVDVSSDFITIQELNEINDGINVELDGIIPKTGLENEVLPTFIDGYIKYTNGTTRAYSTAGDYKMDISYYPIIDGAIHKYNGTLRGGVDEAGIAFYDASKVYISGTNVMPSDGVLVFPTNAKYFRISDYKANSDHTGVKLTITKTGSFDAEILEINTEIDAIIERVGKSDENVPLILVIGYIDYTDGTYHYSDDANKYYCDTRYFPIGSVTKYKYTGGFKALAGIAFYDASKVYISGTNVMPSDGVLVFPTNAKYFRISDYEASGIHTTTKLFIFYPGMFLPMIEALQSEKQINCTGDSVTEGMAVNGGHTADYGKSPYPARLYTLLVDNGYIMTVKNYGHGGERTPDICARLGGIAAYITEDITIPVNNTAQSLGTAVIVNGRATATKLAIYDSDGNGVDYNVFLTQTQTDTNPCYIDGIAYNLAVNVNAMTIAKVVNDNKETIIKAGTQFFTNNSRNVAVNIIYGGINDGGSLTLDKYISRNKACGQVNGGKYIIIGCTHPIWNSWADITAPDKYAFYLRKCREAFGFHFLDLYDMFYRHAVDYALSAGYLSTLTSEQITAVRANMAARIMDGAFTYDGSLNNVHLNEAGYHVIGLLLFDLLKRLNYI